MTGYDGKRRRHVTIGKIWRLVETRITTEMGRGAWTMLDGGGKRTIGRTTVNGEMVSGGFATAKVTTAEIRPEVRLEFLWNSLARQDLATPVIAWKKLAGETED
jgi:hypothetical protein